MDIEARVKKLESDVKSLNETLAKNASIRMRRIDRLQQTTEDQLDNLDTLTKQMLNIMTVNTNELKNIKGRVSLLVTLHRDDLTKFHIVDGTG